MAPDGVRNNEYQLGWKYKHSGKNQIYWDDDLVKYLFELQSMLEEFAGIKTVDIMTEHKRNGQIFRGHPDYRGRGKWNDWVMVDWGLGYGQSPAEIWCFVDLNVLSDDFQHNHEGSVVEKGVFAVVEATTECPNKKAVRGEDVTINESDLFIPLLKEVKSFDEDGFVAARKFYLADVSSFVDPICVVPDLSKENRVRYFQVIPRKQWADRFLQWLDSDFDQEEEEINTEETKDHPPEDTEDEPDDASGNSDGIDEEERRVTKKRARKKKA